MRKFTIFTVLLTIIVIIVVAEVAVNEYFLFSEEGIADDLSESNDVPLPDSLDLSKSMETNVLGTTEPVQSEPLEPLVADTGQDIPVEPVDILPVGEAVEVLESGDDSDFESENYVNWNTNVYIRDDQIKSAGFVNAVLENEPHNGFIFKTVYVDDLYDLNVTKTVVKNADMLLAKIYVLQVGPTSSITEVYEVLKVRASEGLDTEINETNEFGQGSFFMNDSKRSSVAFLTVKISNMVYAFSYPKEYHAQIKNLAMLLDYEF